MSSNITRKTRLHCLDGLRGWAALTVVLGHLTFNIFPFDFLLASPLTDTKLAVSIFFILSGFVLSYKLIDTKISLKALCQMLVARYFRLTIPIAAIAILVFFTFKLSFFYNVQASQIEPIWNYGKFYNFTLTFLDSIKFAFFDVYFHYNSNHTYIPPSWTMPVELIGSFFIYGLLFVIGAFNYWNNRKVILILLALAATVINFIHFNYGSFFIYGYVLAHLFKTDNKKRALNLSKVSISNLAVMAFFMVLVISALRTPERSIALMLPILSITVVCSLLCSNRLNAFFSNKVSLFFGKISFPLYLVHVPIYCSFSSWLVIWLKGFDLTQLQVYTVTYFLSVLMSIACAYVLCPVEEFAITMSRHVKHYSWQKLRGTLIQN